MNGKLKAKVDLLKEYLKKDEGLYDRFSFQEIEHPSEIKIDCTKFRKNGIFNSKNTISFDVKEDNIYVTGLYTDQIFFEKYFQNKDFDDLQDTCRYLNINLHFDTIVEGDMIFHGKEKDRADLLKSIYEKYKGNIMRMHYYITEEQTWLKVPLEEFLKEDIIDYSLFYGHKDTLQNEFLPDVYNAKYEYSVNINYEEIRKMSDHIQIFAKNKEDAENQINKYITEKMKSLKLAGIKMKFDDYDIERIEEKDKEDEEFEEMNR